MLYELAHAAARAWIQNENDMVWFTPGSEPKPGSLGSQLVFSCLASELHSILLWDLLLKGHKCNFDWQTQRAQLHVRHCIEADQSAVLSCALLQRTTHSLYSWRNLAASVVVLQSSQYIALSDTGSQLRVQPALGQVYFFHHLDL